MKKIRTQVFLGGLKYLLFMISLSIVLCISSREELRLEGCEAVGDNITGNGERGSGLKGDPAEATKGECVHA